MSPEIDVRKALHHGAFCYVLDAVLRYGVDFVEGQHAVICGILSDRANEDLRRKMANIKRGISIAEDELSAKPLGHLAPE